MNLHALSTRFGGAAENMAVDFLLLQRYPEAGVPRFRHYGWHRPAFTFGYSQKIAWVREQIGGLVTDPGIRVELGRRPTGGGIVDHREDWTFALVIPRGHTLEQIRATDSYRAVHEALAASLREQSVPAEVKQRRDLEPEDNIPPATAMPGVCFERAELFDVVHAVTGAKIAGAAQKRNKHGLLFQGSIWRPAAGVTVDWDEFAGDFVAALGRALGAEPTDVPWPDWNEEEVGGLTEQYASPEWLEAR